MRSVIHRRPTRRLSRAGGAARRAPGRAGRDRDGDRARRPTGARVARVGARLRGARQGGSTGVRSAVAAGGRWDGELVLSQPGTRGTVAVAERGVGQDEPVHEHGELELAVPGKQHQVLVAPRQPFAAQEIAEETNVQPREGRSEPRAERQVGVDPTPPTCLERSSPSHGAHVGRAGAGIRFSPVSARAGPAARLLAAAWGRPAESGSSRARRGGPAPLTDRRVRPRRHATGGAGGQPQTGAVRPAAVSQLPAEQARAYLAAIVESSVDAIKAQTLDGTVVFWNQATERMYGYAAEEAIGRNILFVVPPERHHEMAEILERVGRGERVEHVETERIRKDGTRLDVSISVSPIRDEQGNVVGAATIARDITEQKRAERGQRLLAAASRLFAEARLDTQAILDGLCRIVVEAMADAAVVGLLAEDGVSLRPAAVYAVEPEQAELCRRLLTEHPVRSGEGLGGRIVQSGQPIVVPVVEPDELRAQLVPGHRPHLTQLRVHSLLGVPLRAYGRTVGALLLSRHSATRPYAEEDLAIVHELADRAAMALDAARVHA